MSETISGKEKLRAIAEEQLASIAEATDVIDALHSHGALMMSLMTLVEYEVKHTRMLVEAAAEALDNA